MVEQVKLMGIDGVPSQNQIHMLPSELAKLMDKKKKKNEQCW